jgi:hypothetical protein
MTISKAQYQDPNYVPQDLVELGEAEEREEAEREAWIAGTSERLEQTIARATRAYYVDLRRNAKLTHNRAALAADPEGRYFKLHSNMAGKPAKKTFTKKGGSSKVTKAKVVRSKTPGTGKADNTKAIAAAVNKALSKNIETQHSYMDIIMFPGAKALTGNIMGSLNKGTKTITDASGKQSIVEAFDNNRAMAVNLSTLMQVRGGNASAPSGWRTGYKSNVLSIRVDVRGNITNCATECKFHAVLARKKDGQRPLYHTPTIINFDESMLWRKNYGGPYAHSYLHYDFPTLDKKNTEAWSWPVGGHVERTVAPIAIEGATRHFQLSMYKEIKDVWEFTSDNARADPSLKDGDYCLFVFREGADDMPGINSSLRVTVDIAFKDT